MTKKKRKYFKLKRFIFTVTLLVFLVLGGWSAITLAGDYLIDEEKLTELQQATQENSYYVNIDEMPDYLWKAFVAIEDHRFKQHEGVDFKALLRALWVNITEGSKAQGGSTITMQLSRNLFLTNEKELSRKIKEMIIAINLEQRFSKEEILEMYLNQIYFGHGKNGIEAAANFYFGKTAKVNSSGTETVTLSEAALLAALPKAPEHYSPVKDLEKALDRRNVVLERMAEVGYISESEVQTAIQQEINIVSNEKDEKIAFGQH